MISLQLFFPCPKLPTCFRSVFFFNSTKNCRPLPPGFRVGLVVVLLRDLSLSPRSPRGTRGPAAPRISLSPRSPRGIARGRSAPRPIPISQVSAWDDSWSSCSASLPAPPGLRVGLVVVLLRDLSLPISQVSAWDSWSSCSANLPISQVSAWDSWSSCSANLLSPRSPRGIARGRACSAPRPIPISRSPRGTTRGRPAPRVSLLPQVSAWDSWSSCSAIYLSL